jgi:hypothetical protein
LLQQHFEDVRHVLPQLLKATVDEMERKLRQAAERMPAPERTPASERTSMAPQVAVAAHVPYVGHRSKRWWILRFAFVAAALVVIVGAFAWWQSGKGEPAAGPARIYDPNRGIQPSESELRQHDSTSEVLSTIRAKRDVWDQRYRTGKISREIKILLSRGREDRAEGQAPTIAKAVLDAAVRYEQDAVLTTLLDEDRLAVALVQLFVRQESSHAKFQIDGVLSWKEPRHSEGQSAPYVEQYLNQRYLAPYGTSVEALAGARGAPDFPQLVADLERALLVDHVLQAGR